MVVTQSVPGLHDTQSCRGRELPRSILRGDPGNPLPTQLQAVAVFQLLLRFHKEEEEALLYRHKIQRYCWRLGEDDLSEPLGEDDLSEPFCPRRLSSAPSGKPPR